MLVHFLWFLIMVIMISVSSWRLCCECKPNRWTQVKHQQKPFKFMFREYFRAPFQKATWKLCTQTLLFIIMNTVYISSYIPYSIISTCFQEAKQGYYDLFFSCYAGELGLLTLINFNGSFNLWIPHHISGKRNPLCRRDLLKESHYAVLVVSGKKMIPYD